MSTTAATTFSVADRLAPFGVTIFAEMTRLAVEHRAINLAQGFPDFDAPAFIRDAAKAAIDAGHNQYPRTFGIPPLCEAIADSWRRATGLPCDPEREITVTSGCTEAIAATLLGLVNPGDEVILFEPFYDSYRACVAMSGATPRFVTLHAPPAGSEPESAFTFDERELRDAFSPRTRAIMLNTPHNPTGKVFTREELDLIARLCRQWNVIAVTDEVYERLTFDPALPHVSLASLPGMPERTVTLSSLGKTFSTTGWKVGWSVAPPALTKGVRAAHQFLTFATSTPFQHAAAMAIREGEASINELVADLRTSRDYLVKALNAAGFRPYVPAGTYFIMAEFAGIRSADSRPYRDDVELCMDLPARIGVAAIPPSAFYAQSDEGKRLVRFAFCKRRATLEQAAQRLGSLR